MLFCPNRNIEALSASKDCLLSIWIIDSGATDHMTSHSNFFSNYTILSGRPKVKVANGTFSSIIGQGIDSITSSLTLQNVLHIPNLSCNLLSVSKITKDLNCFVTFTPSHCVFQDQITRRMIWYAERKGALYYLNTHWKIGDSISQALITTNNPSKVYQIWLWHKWLGHPLIFIMEKMFLTLFGKTKSYDFHCEVCELVKHHHVPFPIRNKKETSLFSLTHIDVWGPSRIPNISGSKWFVTFIDDCTHTTWVYLLKSKSEVNSIFLIFHKFVCTQFGTKIHALRSDNGKEYFNHNFVTYLQNEGIVYQSSCVDTPQQNGVAKKKNKHLLEVARSLLFQVSVPKTYWGEAVLTATFLINRMSSRVLDFKSPIDVL